MKQVRRGVFETNSSSTHSICICTEEDYQQFKANKLMYDKWSDKLTPFSQTAIADGDGQYCSYEDLGNDGWCYLDTYSEHFITPSGDKMVAFGTYGRDG